MLVIANRLRDISFGALMEVYLDANRAPGRALAPQETEERQIALSEQDFYSYLHDSFFSCPGAMYCIWEVDKRYVSALRLEPYQDGLLLEALETAPSQRRKGYAVQLIQSVQRMLERQGSVRLYSHVNKKSLPSLNTHFRCGFEPHLDYAACIDGSVSYRSCTLRYETAVSGQGERCCPAENNLTKFKKKS